MSTTISGNLKDLAGANATGNMFLRFRLRGLNGNIPRVSGTALIPQGSGDGSALWFYDFTPNASGAISGTLYSTRDAAGTGNGDIEAGGSLTAVWYGMVLYVGGIPGPEIPVHAKNTATLDPSNVTPITTTPISTAPTGDTTYARLDGGNTPFTALIQFAQGIQIAIGKMLQWSTDLFLGRGATGTLTVGSTSGATDGTVNATTYKVNGTSPTGTGGLVQATSPTLVTPTLGAATATSVNKVAITAPATGSTLTIADGKTLTASKSITLAGVDGKTLTLDNSLEFAGTDGTVQTFQATDTIVGRSTTDTLKNKTLQGAGSGNAVNLLNQQGPSGALTGNSADQTVFTFAIPANTIQAGKGFKIEFTTVHTTGSASVAYKIILGTTTLTSWSDSGAAALTGYTNVFNAAGVQNSQYGNSFAADGATIVQNQVLTGAENLANGLNIKLTFNVANTDQVTPKFWKVTLEQ